MDFMRNFQLRITHPNLRRFFWRDCRYTGNSSVDARTKKLFSYRSILTFHFGEKPTILSLIVIFGVTIFSIPPHHLS